MSYRPADTNILDITDVDLDTFQVFIEKFNWVVDHMRYTVVTVSNSNAYNGNNAGNGVVNGIFGSTTLFARDRLRGGNVSTTNTLTITSELVVANSATVSNNLTVLGTTNLYILNVSGATNIANTLTVSGNTALGDRLSVANNVTIAGTTTFKTDVVNDVAANTNLGSNVSSPQTVYSFLKTDFTGGKMLVQTKAGANSQVYEGVFTHDGTTADVSIYGVVSVPTSANNGIVSAGSNSTHILIRYLQTGANTSFKASLQLVK